jgi:hypothetical protein
MEVEVEEEDEEEARSFKYAREGCQPMSLSQPGSRHSPLAGRDKP